MTFADLNAATPWLMQGDCLERMREIPDASIHAVVCDPPYGLSDHKPAEVIACLTAWLAGQPYHPKGKGFMGKTWDAWVPGPEVWRECLRVLKPGGHLVAFAGTRSMDLMCMAVRLAGFELRDSIGYASDGGGAPLVAWTHGQGFPKSRDVSTDMQGDIAEKWDGWGTALKPAWEPIILARKSLTGTIAANVLEHGTGAINVDGCRVEGEGGMKWEKPRGGIWSTDSEARARLVPNTQGRFPANLVHDGSDAVLAAFPTAPGQQGDLKGHAKTRQSPNGTFGKMAPAHDHAARKDSSTSAARFFYCAKATRKDRDEGLDAFPEQIADPYAQHRGRRMPEGSDRFDGKPAAIGRNTHPTVKPTNLMRWLVRLVTPPDGIVLDPFAGSGSTGKAAVLEGFRFIGIEREEPSFVTAQARVAAAVAQMTDEQKEAA